jgi:hypothetical protein
MSEIKINLKGWKAIAGLVVLIAVIGVRLMTFSDLTDDETLMREIELQLMTDYFPDDVERLRAVLETGDKHEVERVAKSITSTKMNVESVQASSPLFSFATSTEVVIKVGYSLVDDSGTRERGTKYYLFERGSLVDVWRYMYDVTAISYYLNFI